MEESSLIGKTFAHYRITEKLGEGGMGVVYKARDTHLDRFVALKVLPPEKVADPERKQRFAQEAKSASSLNHPGIITIHDIASDGGVDFIAMEYLEGKTLDQLIPRNGMRIDEVLKIGAETADALAAAHSIGIIHRDVKPSNIMVSEQGRVKVLDFGLAKLRQTAPAATSQTTDTAPVATREGRIVGTVSYMSPEQAQAGKVDARSDIFSFGSVLYEMVTGRRAFEGPTVISTLSAILHLDPKPVATVVDTPPELQRIIGRCLRKAPERRFQSIADVGVVLNELREELEPGSPATDGVPSKAVSSRRAGIGRRGRLAAALVIAAVAAGYWMTRRRPPLVAPVLTRLTFDSGLTFEPALSPDGKLVAYASDRSGDGNLDIWVHQVAGGEAIRLTRHAADDREPAFSPDGDKIAFRSEREGGGIYVVPAIGGNERLIAPHGRTPRFSPDGQWIAYWVGTAAGIDTWAPGWAGQIFVVPSTGATPRQLAPKFLSCRHPVWTPDGKHILFAAARDRFELNDVDWWVTPIENGEAVRTGAYAVFGPLGFLARFSPWVSPSMWVGHDVVFSVPAGDTTNLWRIPISSSNWRVTGAPERVTFGAGVEVQPSAAQGAGGARVAFANVASHNHVWSLPLDSSRARITGDLKQLTTSADDRQPSLSADGRTLVFSSNRTGNTDVWIKDLSSDREMALTATPVNEDFPRVTLDGRKVAYATANQGGTPFYVDVVPAGGGVPERVCDDCGLLWDWSSDGRRILFGEGAVRSVGPVDTAARKTDFLKHPRYSLVVPQLSPDDKWIVVIAADVGPGRTQVLLVPSTANVTPAEDQWIPVTDGSTFEDKPRWSPDGGMIYYTSDRDGFRCLWAQPLDPTTRRPTGPPQPVYHFHTARRSLLNAGVLRATIAVARDKIAFTMGEITGNIWLAQWNAW